MKFLIFLMLLSISNLVNANELSPRQGLDTIWGQVYGGNEYYELVFTKEMTINFREDDDVYLQNGKRVYSNEFNNTIDFCAFDSDINISYAGYRSRFFEITDEKIIIKKGFSVPIYIGAQNVNFSSGSISYDFQLASPEMNKQERVLDNFSCYWPLSKKRAMTYSDLQAQVGNLFIIREVSKQE